MFCHTETMCVKADDVLEWGGFHSSWCSIKSTLNIAYMSVWSRIGWSRRIKKCQFDSERRHNKKHGWQTKKICGLIQVICNDGSHNDDFDEFVIWFINKAKKMTVFLNLFRKINCFSFNFNSEAVNID